MRIQFLVPGVQHGQKAKLRSQMAPVGGNGEQAVRNRLKPDVEECSRILESEQGKLVWQREGDMRVRDWEQFPGGPGQPLVARPGLALRAGAIAAGVEDEELVRAVVALFPASAESGGSACADVAEGLALLGREGVAPAGQEFLFVLAKDIGDFQPMWGHRCRLSSSERSMGFSCRASKGLRTACKRCSDTCR